MGNTIIKSLAQEVQITSSTTLYRIGNLRILRIVGTSCYGEILAEYDRPSRTIISTALATSQGGNLGACLGSLVVGTNGVITCTYSAYYNNQNAGFSPLQAPNELFGTAIWTV